MAVERSEGSFIEVLDRVLDKGIVFDAWVRVALVGIDLITVQARVVVASIETYLQNAEALAQVASGAAPALEAEPSAATTKRSQPIAITAARRVPHPRWHGWAEMS